MSEPRKHHLVIDGAQVKEDEQNIGLYKAIPENDTDFRTSKSSLHKSREKASIDGAEEKLLSKEDEAKIVTRVDMADAKYVVGDHRNGDAKIELDANKRQFTGLTKEELLKYADDPFWVRLRWFMFVLFWALWLAMLAGAIAIIVTAPKCAAPEPKAWFEKGPIIDMEKGLSEISSSDLEKLKEINPEAIYVDVDTPYDILDSGADVAKFKDIIAQAKDVKVILDMSLTSVPTSHRWFSLSANRTPEYETYFIWASPKEYNGTEPLPPNKWVSTFNTSAWRWSDARSQFYLQQTTAGEADLNLTDSRVRAQAGDVIAKWIGLGAAGIRLVNARELLIDPTLADEVPASGAAARASDHTQYGFWRHARASDQPGLAQLLAEWASVVRTSAKTDYPAVLTTEERGDRPEYFLSVHNNASALRPRTARVVLGTDSAAAAKAIGDRLGTWPALKLWSPSNNSELAAWSLLLPATPVLTLRDFTVQNNSDGESLVHLLRLRSDVSVQHGEFIVSAVPARNRSDTLLAVARWKAGHTGYAGVYNPLPTAARADLRSLRSVPDTVSVLYVSADVRADTNYTTNLSIPSDDVLVPSQSSVLLSYVPVITPVE